MTTIVIGAAWRSVRDRFRAAGLETPERDAQALACLALGIDPLGLVNREPEPTAPGAMARLEELASRRLGGEPVARIAGRKGFYGLDFALGPATLVPRPETELVVELALGAISGLARPAVLDLGTGTGCIAIAILANHQGARAVAVDASPEALAVARANAVANGVTGRLELRAGDWFGDVAEGERFDAIVSNPPYIETGAIAGLMPEVARFDPLAALDGGPDGLDAYREIIPRAPAYLKQGAPLVLEIGSEQRAAVAALMVESGFSGIESKKDLAGLDRALIGSHCPCAGER